MGEKKQRREVRVLAIVGPTASGKTQLSLSLARHLDAEIISADSRQVYRRLDIGTAKPTRAEQRDVVHHFVDILEPDQDYSAGEFGKSARRTLEQIRKRGKLPLIVGGSGLYVQALVDGFFEGPGRDPEIRARLEQEERGGGLNGLMEKLELVDPVSAESMRREPKVRRVIRALEVYYSTGKPLSAHHEEQSRDSLGGLVMVAPLWDRSALYRNIETRVDRMMEEGLVEEVRSVGRDYPGSLNALNTVGYSEIRRLLEGKYTEDEAVRQIKQNTRRFAKRQMTWFRRDQRIEWMAVASNDDLGEVAQTILRRIKMEA